MRWPPPAFRGARTIAMDVDDAKLDIARLAGATHVIHTGRQDVAKSLSELTDAADPDVVIEAVGSPETFRAAVELVAFTGRVVYIGYAKERDYETRLFVQKELNILGARNALPEDFRQVIRILGQHRFPVGLAISALAQMDQDPQSSYGLGAPSQAGSQRS